MDTRLLEKETIGIAVEMLLHDEIVVLPTETVYGLAGNAKSDIACKKIYAIKNRPHNNPLIVHCSDIRMARQCMKKHPNDEETKMIAMGMTILEHFAPAPITVIVPASKHISSFALADGDSIALRIPNHTLCLDIIQKAGIPLAAPSANISGSPSATNELMAWEALQGKVAGIMNGGSASIGIESTIVHCGETHATIVREGYISAQNIMEKTTILIQTKKHNDIHEVPGNNYKHYAPQCMLHTINANMDYEESKSYMINIVQHNQKKRIAFASVLHQTESKKLYHTIKNDMKENIVFTRSYAHWENLAHNLYELFAESDRREIDILILPIPKQETYPALHDRITRAMQK